MKTIFNPITLIMVALFLALDSAPAVTYTNLYNFSNPTYDNSLVIPGFINSDGYFPYGSVVSSNTFYGVTSYGGLGGVGTVFRINTDGTQFTNLFTFPALVLDSTHPGFATDNGSHPNPGLLLSGNTLYGTTHDDGPHLYGLGTVYKINTDGTGFGVLQTFTNLNGQQPSSGLTLSGNTLYGTTAAGGSNGWGTVFKINTDGTGFTNLYNFTLANGANIDGAEPYAGVILSGSTLYGTTTTSGSGGQGTVFQLNTDGTGFTNLYDFSFSDGAQPYAGVILSGGTLYGTTVAGGSPGSGVRVANGSGVVFGLVLIPPPVPLNVRLISNAVILSWTAPSLSLYTAPIITNVFTKITGATSPYTNVVTGTQQYFRLQ